MVEETLSLIIPAYNEEERITQVLETFLNDIKKANAICNILVISDGTDRTDQVVKEFAKKHKNVDVMKFKERLGKGGAIIKGFKSADSTYVGFVDCDDSVSFQQVFTLLESIKKKRADGAIASRRIGGAIVSQKQPFMRRFPSKAFNLLVRLMFGLRFKDTQCGAKIFKTSAIKDILPQMKSKGFEFDVELLWRLTKKGYKIIEIPVVWKHSEGSKFSLKHAPSMFANLLSRRLNL